MPMKKTQTFNSGVLDIFGVGDNDCITPTEQGLRFGERTVGSRRFFESYEFGRRADRIVRIPYRAELAANSVVIIGAKQYNVLQAQAIFDTSPSCTQLTLEEIREGWYHEAE